MGVLTRWSMLGVACFALGMTVDAQVVSVTVAPLGPQSMQVGAQLQLSATAVDAAGNSVPAPLVIWSSRNPNVATVSATGMVTAVAMGSATIRAQVQTIQAQKEITVTSGAPPLAPPDSSSDRAVATATFVFLGTVHRVGTFTQQTPPARFAAVTVDTIIRVPPSVDDIGADTVTVVYGPTINVTVGQKYVMYATGLSDDSTLVLSATAARPASGAAAWVGALTDSMRAAEQRVADRRYWARYDSAAVVAVGVVREITPVRRTMPRGTVRSSEHAPLWRHAVVGVERLHKGPPALRDRSFTVVFPASRDIRYARRTPLATGDTRLFTLRAWNTVPARMLSGIDVPSAYVLLDSLDNLPIGDTIRIKRR